MFQRVRSLVVLVPLLLLTGCASVAPTRTLAGCVPCPTAENPDAVRCFARETPGDPPQPWYGLRRELLSCRGYGTWLTNLSRRPSRTFPSGPIPSPWSGAHQRVSSPPRP